MGRKTCFDVAKPGCDKLCSDGIIAQLPFISKKALLSSYLTADKQTENLSLNKHINAVWSHLPVEHAPLPAHPQTVELFLEWLPDLRRKDPACLKINGLPPIAAERFGRAGKCFISSSPSSIATTIAHISYEKRANTGSLYPNCASCNLIMADYDAYPFSHISDLKVSVRKNVICHFPEGYFVQRPGYRPAAQLATGDEG